MKKISVKAVPRRNRALAGLLAGILSVGFAVVGTATPAAAAYDKVYCNINPITGYKQTRYCTPIEPHASQHWVLIDVDQLARSTEWWLTEVDTGVVKAHGFGDARNRTIYNLTGSLYQLKVYGYGTNAWAANCTSNCNG